LLAHPDKYQESPKVIRLWCHEVYRVFYDRLVDESDRSWFFDTTTALTSKHFNVKFGEIMSHLDFNKDGKIEDDDLRSLMLGIIRIQMPPLSSTMKFRALQAFLM
jgi:dynein heavy chain